jgi:MIP family channel proteins
MSLPLMRELRVHVAEFIGTFALVFVGCGTIAVGKVGLLEVSLAFGITIGVMVYAVGYISGAHFNPAVSIGLAVTRRFPWKRVPTYVLAQVAGAVVAAVLLRLSLGSGASLGVTHPSGSDGQSLVFEGVLTFFLVFVVAAVATDPRAVRQAAGVAIGGAITLDLLVGGPVSGGSMNPARSFGPALVAGDWAGLWIYIVGPVAGAAVAGLVYAFLRDEKPPAA